MSLRQSTMESDAEHNLRLLQDYAESLFRACNKIDGEPTKTQISELKGLFDNVELWMDALQD